MVWAAAGNNGCRLGHHCCNRASPISITNRGIYNVLSNTSDVSTLCWIEWEYIFIINISMAILVTMLCERANDHGGCRRPMANLSPHSRRHTTIRNHTKKQVTLLNLEKNMVMYTIMTIKGTERRARPRYLAKDVKIGPHNDDLYCAQLVQTSISRVSRRHLPFRRSRDELFNKRRWSVDRGID
jgi:hypothetical protein